MTTPKGDPSIPADGRWKLARVPASLAIISAVCGAIALYEWWDLVGCAAAGMGAGVAGIWFGRCTGRRWARAFGWILSMLSLGLAVLVLFFCLSCDVGYVRRVESWPSTLTEMVKEAGTDPTSVTADCLGRFFLSSGHVWKMPVASNDLDRVTQKLWMSPIEFAEVPSWFWGMFPIWWRADRSASNRFFAIPGSTGEPKHGLQMIAEHESRSGYLYVWCQETG